MSTETSDQSRPTASPDVRDFTAGSLFESIIVHANDVVVVTEAEPIDAPAGGPRVLYVNPAFTRMTGYQAHEIVGRTPRIMQSPRTDRAELDRLRTALENWESVEVELLNVRKDGVEFWVQLNITPVADDTGRYTHWIAIQRDISERRQRDDALRSMLATTSDLLLLASDGDVRAVSASSLRVLGYTPEQLEGSRFAAAVHPEDTAADAVLFQGSIAPRFGKRATTTARVRASDGSWRWLDMVAGEHPGHGTGGGIVVACTDVTERRWVQEALEAANGRFMSAFDHAPIGMALTSLAGEFIQVNTALCDLLGRSPDELLELTMRELTHEDDAQHAERQRQALVQGTVNRQRHETRFLHADGTAVGILHSSSVVRDAEGKPVLLIDHVENITERQMFERRLQHQALHDPLTGLPNRALFMDRLDRALQADQPGGGRVAVLFCDIDRFKTINDTYGHPVGDLVLTTIAQRIQAALRPTDTVGRLGGDELAILCAESGLREAEATASALRAALAEPISVSGAAIAVTISIGIALSAPGQTDADQLLRDSDDAMYSAKGSGRDRYAVHDVSDARTNRRRLLLTADLPAAIAEGQLRLHFQPQVDLASGEPTAMEALVRWEHPDHGLLMPAEFIDIAEEAGLMRDLGRWVLEQVVRLRAARLSGVDGPGAAVADVIWLNVSASELNDIDFAAGVEDALRRHGLPGALIGIEITESVLMTNLTRAHSNLVRLRSLGVHLAIDDFGTGYSSLSYIGQFPVDTVKIDASFVAGLDSAARRRESFAVVTAVITLAHSLGMRVIAEGIETPTQSLILHGLGCDQGQGYLYGKPRALDF